MLRIKHFILILLVIGYRYGWKNQQKIVVFFFFLKVGDYYQSSGTISVRIYFIICTIDILVESFNKVY